MSDESPVPMVRIGGGGTSALSRRLTVMGVEEGGGEPTAGPDRPKEAKRPNAAIRTAVLSGFPGPKTRLFLFRMATPWEEVLQRFFLTSVQCMGSAASSKRDQLESVLV